MSKLGVHYESEIKIGKETRKLFLQDGFFRDTILFGNLHSHKYTEILTVVGGNTKYLIGNEVYDICDGECLAIPAGVLHYCTYADSDVLHSSFQVDLTVTSFRKCRVPEGIIPIFLKESKRPIQDVNRLKISGYIQIIIAELFPEFAMRVDPMMDTAFIIHEFFSRGYNLDLKLSDLAEQLHLSEKQSARLVEIHMGKTFKQALIAQRMNIAKHLIAIGEMSFSEIGEHLGYKSYGGFYKAYTKYFGCHGAGAIPPPTKEQYN